MYSSAAALLVPLAVRSAHKTVGVAAAVQSLSDIVAVQYILADIPFFAVGILALGAFTFFLFLRRVSWVILSLHLSVFLCFAAAILDLVQILFRGRFFMTANADTNPVLGLTITREILYAVSAGTRFLFLWGMVACPPYGETVPSKAKLHNGSWGRWGLFGHGLRWTILAVVFAIMTLQILYRVLTPLHQYGPIYQTEATMQIVLSSVFILKLLMNSYLVGISSLRVRAGAVAVMHYLPLMVALGINVAVGVGNLFEFLFTETVFGRFLQAIEFYVLILYLLVYSFLDLRATPLSSPPRNRSSSFQALPPLLSRDSSFRIPPPRVSTPDLVTAMQSRIASLEQVAPDRRPSQGTTRASLARLSTWIGSRRVSQKLGIGAPLSPSLAGDRLWSRSEAEKGMATADLDAYEIEVQPRQYSLDQSPTEPKEIARYQDPLFTSIVREVPIAGMSSREPSRPKSPPVMRAPTSPQMTIDIPPPILTASDETNSPIYGLNGIVRPVVPEPQPFEDREDPRTYFDRSPTSSDGGIRSSAVSGLLRQQEELDRSIAALKLFTSPSSRRTSFSSGTAKPVSAAPSDFSLSNFPSPPWRKSLDAQGEASPSSSKSAMANAERFVQVIPADADRRSHSLSVALMPTEDAQQQPRVDTRTPPLLVSARTPYEASSSVFNSLQPAFAESRETLGEYGYTRSRSLLQPISESQSNASVSSRLSPTPDAMSLSSAGVSPAPSIRRQLPTPPQTAGRDLSTAPTSIPRLASGKVGLPTRPRLADRRTGSPSWSNAYERPKPSASPLARPL